MNALRLKDWFNIEMGERNNIENIGLYDPYLRKISMLNFNVT